LNTNNFREPTEDEIQSYIDRHHLNRVRNWWHVRETLRRELNGPPPDGHTDWGIYWKTI
jgi:hypothetical protein